MESISPLEVNIQANSSEYPNLRSAFAKIVKRDGFKGLYRGSLSPMYGVGLVNAVLFGTYSNSLRYLSNNREVTLADHYFAGVISGTFFGLITTPVDFLKSRLQVGGYSGNIDCIRQTIKIDGFTGMFKGVTASVLRDSWSFSFYFITYEYLKSKFGNSNLAMLNAGGISGVVCWLSCYPIDIVKTRMQTQPLENPLYTSTWDCVRKIYKQEGIRGFSRGLTPCLVRAYPVNAVTFIVYEKLKEIFN
jgi:solute carrier family 25 carnitine/acylcarnitine transporter 20/29